MFDWPVGVRDSLVSRVTLLHTAMRTVREIKRAPSVITNRSRPSNAGITKVLPM
jgi:hypothetical protein